MSDPSSAKPFIVGIGGTMRPNSSSERALRTSLKSAEALGAETLMFSGMSLDLPMYTPDARDRTPGARQLVDALRRCDGVIIAAAAYHGSISGLLKNALDYAEDLRTDTRPYLDDVPIGCIACAGGWQACGQTLAALRAVAHALRGWPTPLGAMLNTSASLFAEDGSCTDGPTKSQLEQVGYQVVRFTRLMTAAA